MTSLSHNPRRRLIFSAGGGLLFSAFFWRPTAAADEIQITMSGSSTGSHVWFSPRGLLIKPGQTIRWINSDAGNVHTITAYHPDNNKPLRIPSQAKPWNSGYLMPDETFMMKLSVPGVYDYFCIPHEQAGMVGRIVVGEMHGSNVSARPYAETDDKLPENALAGLADVSEILLNTVVD